MKEKVIETAGKTWKFLAQYGETSISQLSQLINEQDTIVYQSLGWLAREDKINYTTKNRKTFVSLAGPEVEAFRRISEAVLSGGNGDPKKASKNRIR